MAKNQEARKRKHASRNGSSGRGNGADLGRLNGKSKHKTENETPTWQKSLGALVLIAAVLAAAFLTGVIRIDRNIVDTDEEQDSYQEAQPTVAEINDSKSNKTTSKYSLKEPNTDQASQETFKESNFRDKEHIEEAKYPAKDTKLEDKATKVESRTKDQTEGVQRSQESNTDIPAKANATKKKRDTLDIPEVTTDGEQKVEKKDEQREEKVKGRTQERSSKEKKKKYEKIEVTPEDARKEETPEKGREEKIEPAQEVRDTENNARSSKAKESTVQETDSPKGKMVTPKRSPKKEQKSKEPKNKSSPSKDVKTNTEEASKQPQTRGDRRTEVPSQSDSKASSNEAKTASDRSESKSGAKEDASTSKKDKKVEEAAKRKTAKDDAVSPPPPQERIQPEEKRTVQDGDQSKDNKKAKELSQKDRGKKSIDLVINDKEALLKETETIKSKESEKKKLEKAPEKMKEKVQQESKKPVPVRKDSSSSEETKPKAKDSTPKDSPPKDSPPSSTSSKKSSSEPIPDEKRTPKSKEPSEQKTEKVDQAKSDTHPQDRSSEKPEHDTRTKPIKENPTKPTPSKDRPSRKVDPKVTSSQPPSMDNTKESPKTKTKSPIDPEKPIKDSPPKSTPPKDGPSMKVAQDPKITNPQPPSIDNTKDNPKTKTNTKSQVDPELPPSSPPSSQSRESPKDDDVAKTTSGGGRDKAVADNVGDASKTTAHVSRKTESKKPEDKKPNDKKTVSVIDTLLEEAESLNKKGKQDQAAYKYEDIIKRFPHSAKALYKKAKLLDTLAEERRSNDLLENAIKAYRQAADIPTCPRDIHKAALSRMAERLSFFGKAQKSIRVYQELVREYPDDYEAKKDLAVQYLIMGANDKAKPYFEQMLEINPMDGFALVHMGFILKTEGNYQEAIPFLRAGIDTGDRGTNEGKFFFQLGDSFLRIGEIDESYKVYDEAVSRGHFRSRYQRSLYNVDSLRGKPFWTPKDAGFTEAVKKLESNWETIRDEALALLGTDGLFKNEEEKLRETGDWKQFTLFAQGSKHQANCRQAPRTCEIFETIPESSGCKRGQVKFSVMHPGTHVWPHCGPTNCRLRSHLGLVIPQPVRLRVGNITRTWDEGKVFIFDDSFEHEVWQEADRLRLVLIADLWHPDLTESEKRRLTPI